MVTKSQPRLPDDRRRSTTRPTARPSADVADYLVSQPAGPDRRASPGVGDISVFGAQYAMRIWLDPSKLASFKPDARRRDRARSRRRTPRSRPARSAASRRRPSQMLNATVTARSRLTTAGAVPQDHRQDPDRRLDGAAVGDVARVELGSENYDTSAGSTAIPASGIAIQLAPGADALKTADAGARPRSQAARKSFPPGYSYAFPFDSTDLHQALDPGGGARR